MKQTTFRVLHAEERAASRRRPRLHIRVREHMITPHHPAAPINDGLRHALLAIPDLSMATRRHDALNLINE